MPRISPPPSDSYGKGYVTARDHKTGRTVRLENEQQWKDYVDKGIIPPNATPVGTIASVRPYNQASGGVKAVHQLAAAVNPNDANINVTYSNYNLLSDELKKY